MADQDYKVKITTTGDPAGANVVAESLQKVGESAQQTEQGLRQLIDAGKALGRDTSALEAELKNLRSAQASGVLSAYIAELEQAIVLGKSAGANVSDLERQLAAIQSNKPDLAAAARAEADQVEQAKARAIEALEIAAQKEAEAEEAKARALEATQKELKDAAFWTLFYKTGTDKAAAGSKDLGRDLANLSRAGQETGRVMNGLSQGGIGGLITACRGAIGVIKALATGTIGAVLLPIVAAAGGALLLLGKRARDNAAEMRKAFDEAAKNAEDFKTRLEAATAGVQESLRLQGEAVQQLTRDFDELLGRIDQASKRNTTLATAERAALDAQLDADEQQAIANARPDERDDVRRTFARRRRDVQFQRQEQDITNTDLSATVREKAASEAQQAARAELDALGALIREAQAKADEALARTQQYAATDSSPDAMAARNEARVQQETVKKLEADAARPTAIAAKADAEVQAAALAREEAALRRRELDARRTAEGFARGTEDRDLDIQRRERAREEDVQFRANSTGAGIEELFGQVLKSPRAQSDALRPLYEKILAAAQEIQGQSTGEEIAQLSTALTQLVEATKAERGGVLPQIRELTRQVQTLSSQISATRVR
ncbi:MAG: hypothetical protein C0518_05600 [Opitutus sp.]|nr:hypothetical protein [Opitutus sp.]